MLVKLFWFTVVWSFILFDFRLAIQDPSLRYRTRVLPNQICNPRGTRCPPPHIRATVHLPLRVGLTLARHTCNLADSIRAARLLRVPAQSLD